MYSLVLMMAMNGSAPEIPQFHHRTTSYVVSSGCSGCCGGAVYVSPGCCGGGCCGGYQTHWGYGEVVITNWSPGFVYPTTWSSFPACGCSESVIYPSAPTTTVPPTTAPATEPKKEMPKSEEPKKPVTLNQVSARLLRSEVQVELPEGAKLYVNDSAKAIQSADGRFQTPELPEGEEFAYSFRAVMEVNGDRKELTRKVTFRPGQPLNVDLREVEIVRK